MQHALAKTLTLVMIHFNTVNDNYWHRIIDGNTNQVNDKKVLPIRLAIIINDDAMAGND